MMAVEENIDEPVIPPVQETSSVQSRFILFKFVCIFLFFTFILRYN